MLRIAFRHGINIEPLFHIHWVAYNKKCDVNEFMMQNCNGKGTFRVVSLFKDF